MFISISIHPSQSPSIRHVDSTCRQPLPPGPDPLLSNSKCLERLFGSSASDVKMHRGCSSSALCINIPQFRFFWQQDFPLRVYGGEVVFDGQPIIVMTKRAPRVLTNKNKLNTINIQFMILLISAFHGQMAE